MGLSSVGYRAAFTVFMAFSVSAARTSSEYGISFTLAIAIDLV
jgi:hypothetical protein